MAAPAAAPSLRRLVTEVGKAARFGSPDEEVARILAHKSNYYIVLKVLKDTDPAEVRSNYFKLSRLVHPDKCSNPQAADASAVLNQAKETLTNPLKKRLYDAYVTDVTEATGAGGEEMSYAEWEAAQAVHAVKIPRWVERILAVPIVGQVFALLVLIILLPLVLIFVLLILVLWLVCIPINVLLRCCCGSPEQLQARMEARQAAAAGQHQSPHVAPQQAEANV